MGIVGGHSSKWTLKESGVKKIAGNANEGGGGIKNPNKIMNVINGCPTRDCRGKTVYWDRLIHGAQVPRIRGQKVACSCL